MGSTEHYATPSFQVQVWDLDFCCFMIALMHHTHRRDQPTTESSPFSPMTSTCMKWICEIRSDTFSAKLVRSAQGFTFNNNAHVQCWPGCTTMCCFSLPSKTLKNDSQNQSTFSQILYIFIHLYLVYFSQMLCSRRRGL